MKNRTMRICADCKGIFWGRDEKPVCFHCDSSSPSPVTGAGANLAPADRGKAALRAEGRYNGSKVD